MSCTTVVSCLFICEGERLTDLEVDFILKYTGTEEDLDGNFKYEGTCSSLYLMQTFSASLDLFHLILQVAKSLQNIM